MDSLKSGRRIQKADMDFFTQAYAEGDPNVYNNIKSKLDAGQSLNDADYEQLFNEARKMATNPENKAKIVEMAQKAEQGRVSQNVKSGLNLVLAGTDIATSLSQINKSARLGRSTPRPAEPGALQRDPYLGDLLTQSSQGANDVNRTILPAKEGIREQYQNDLAAARTASGGQSGAYGAYAQGAADRRERANLNLVPLADQVRRQNQSRYDNLVGQHVQEGQAINASQGRYYPENLYQYNLQQQLAANLGQIGRSNLRSSMTGLASELPGVISRHIYNRMMIHGGPENAQIAQDAHEAVDNNWSKKPVNFPMYGDYENGEYN